MIGFLYFWGFLWLWKLTFFEHWIILILQFCFLGYLSYLFYYMLLFPRQLIKRKRNKNQFFSYFWRMLPKFEEKHLEIHKHSWLSIIWILKKLNFIQTLVKDILEIKHQTISQTTFKAKLPSEQKLIKNHIR